MKWNREAKEVDGHSYVVGSRPRVFCASLADWLDDEVPIEWLADMLDLVRTTPNIDWLLLTKRPENWGRVDYSTTSTRVGKDYHGWITDWVNGYPPANVWIGTTVEDQKRADERIPLLLSIPARIRFLSCEPLLGLVELANVTHRSDCVAQLAKRALGGIHWVIVGGESGAKSRPMDEAWARNLRDLCKVTGVAFWMKQMGGHPDPRHELSQLPVDLRVR